MTSSAVEFSAVTAVAKANIYFDGKVVSHTIVFSDGSKKTLGLIYPGEYHFSTGAPERMDIIDGHTEVKLDDGGSWAVHAAGSTFQVPGNSGFTIRVGGAIAQYVCSFE